MPNYEEMMQEVDRRISAIDLNGCDIINDCRMIIVFLKEKLSVLKRLLNHVLSTTMPMKLLFSNTTNR